MILARSLIVLSLLLPATTFAAAATSPKAAPTASKSPGYAERLDQLALRAYALPSARRPLITRALDRLGPGAIDAMLALARQDSPTLARIRKDEPAAAAAFDAALLHAVGVRRDARALDVLTAAFEKREERQAIAAAGDGLGKLCDRGGFEVLARHAVEGDARATPAYASIGLCRTMKSAQLLSSKLESATDEAAVRALTAGIAQVGSTWAWEAMGPERMAEGIEIRARCSSALLAAYPRQESDASRLAIRTALRMVDEKAAKKLER